jgi:hypothetical protein
VEARDEFVEAGQCGQGQMGRVAQSGAQDGELRVRGVGVEAVQRGVDALPHVGAAAEEADPEQCVQRLGEHGVVALPQGGIVVERVDQESLPGFLEETVASG